MKKVAFVVQRCGVEVNGGAEVLCLTIAQRLAAYWETEILTTCALDYMTWENHYPPGVEEVGGTRIRRFPVDPPRHVASFNQLSDRLYPRRREASLEEQETWMRAQGPISPDLRSYVQQQKDAYDAFIFFTYLYATTYYLLPLVEEKAYLAPLAHDEWPIYMSMWDRLFQRPRGFIFNTLEERDFLRTRFPHARLEGPVAGVAVDPPSMYSAERFRTQYHLDAPFLLYVGRIDPAKGCDELFDYFIRLRQQETTPRKLVLLGKAMMPLPEHSDIVALGFVEEQTKWDAIAASDLLVLPSLHESLSIAVLEAWALGRPVLVNGHCAVLVGQCRRARGGLWYRNFEEFRIALEQMSSQIRNRLGLQGKSFIEHTYSWRVIENLYLSTIGR